MSLIRPLVAAAAVFVLFSGPAMALKITNSDADARTVTIVSGDKETEHTLAAGASVEDGCEEGCIVQVAGSDDEFKAESGDDLVIKDNAVHKNE